MSYLFTSESVSEGHPDKVADAISDAVLDLMMREGNRAYRCACETLVNSSAVIIPNGKSSCRIVVSSKIHFSLMKETIERIIPCAIILVIFVNWKRIGFTGV